MLFQGGYLGLSGKTYRETGEMAVIRSVIMICIVHEIFLR
jgi:hypothetical protein